MSLITKSLIRKSVPFPLPGGNRVTFTNPLQSSQNKTGFLEYYNNIVWLRAAVSTIAQAIAQSTWRLYKKTGDGDREEITLGSGKVKISRVSTGLIIKVVKT